MIRLLALVVAVLCGSCSSRTPASAARASVADPTTSVTPPPTNGEADAPAYVPHRIASITLRRATSIVDVASARPPSPSMPLGSVYIAAVLHRDDAGDDTLDPVIFEWDVATERIIAQRQLTSRDTRPHVLRLTTSRDRLYVTSECWVPACNVRLIAMNRKLETIAERTLEDGSGVSLEATEKYVAVAIPRHHLERRPLSISLFDAASLRPVGSKELSASGGPTTGFVRGDVLELTADRLYVAGAGTDVPRRNEEGAILGVSTVFALELPSLAVRASFTTDAPAQLEPRLVGDGRHVLFLANEILTELTPELRVIWTRADVSADAMFGPSGQLFMMGGPSRLRELFPGASMPCTSGWSRSDPVLVCNVGEGLRIARFIANPNRK